MDAIRRMVLCLCLSLTVCQVRSLYVPVKMNRTIQNLLRYYEHDKMTLAERFSGLVFPKKFDGMGIEMKSLLLGGIMETYENLITKMMDELPTQSPVTTDATSSSAPAKVSKGRFDHDIRRQLNYLLTMIQDVRKNMFAEQDNILRKYYTIKTFQMDNKVIQCKALWELQYLYEEANALGSVKTERKSKQRRRRQLLKTRTRATALRG